MLVGELPSIIFRNLPLWPRLSPKFSHSHRRILLFIFSCLITFTLKLKLKIKIIVMNSFISNIRQTEDFTEYSDKPNEFVIRQNVEY